MRHGFSLVELSIVLVILGLLTGGILAGQSLIRAAELRSISADYSRYVAATHTFRDKYSALPGDFPAATRFWSRASAVASCATNSSATVGLPGACDGNGDGYLPQGTVTSGAAENFQYWSQLANAGLIEGSYTGFSTALVCCSGVYVESIPRSNVPAGRISNSAWYVSGYSTPNPGDASSFTAPGGNTMAFGGVSTGAPWGPLLKPEEVWNVDVKLDDGKPGLGKVIVVYWSPCSTASSGTDTAADYKFTTTTNSCAMRFPTAF